MELIRRVWSYPFRSEEWQAGLLWLGWGVLGGLLPLWGTAAILFLFHKPIPFYGLLKNGEFVLYASSFVGGAMYVIRRDIFPSKNTLTMVFSILLAVSVLVFAAITVATLGDKPDWLSMSQEALTTISVIVIALATVTCLLVTVAEVGGEGVDVPKALKESEEDLNKQFELLLKNKGSGSGGVK